MALPGVIFFTLKAAAEELSKITPCSEDDVIQIGAAGEFSVKVKLDKPHWFNGGAEFIGAVNLCGGGELAVTIYQYELVKFYPGREEALVSMFTDVIRDTGSGQHTTGYSVEGKGELSENEAPITVKRSELLIPADELYLYAAKLRQGKVLPLSATDESYGAKTTKNPDAGGKPNTINKNADGKCRHLTGIAKYLGQVLYNGSLSTTTVENWLGLHEDSYGKGDPKFIKIVHRHLPEGGKKATYWALYADLDKYKPLKGKKKIKK